MLRRPSKSCPGTVRPTSWRWPGPTAWCGSAPSRCKLDGRCDSPRDVPVNVPRKSRVFTPNRPSRCLPDRPHARVTKWLTIWAISGENEGWIAGTSLDGRASLTSELEREFAHPLVRCPRTDDYLRHRAGQLACAARQEATATRSRRIAGWRRQDRRTAACAVTRAVAPARSDWREGMVCAASVSRQSTGTRGEIRCVLNCG